MRLKNINDILDTLCLIVDTREQNYGDALDRYNQRVESTRLKNVREALMIGDYSAQVVIDGKKINLSDRFCIERKANLSEMAATLSSKRLRNSFLGHLKQAVEEGVKYYLIIEDTSYSELLDGKSEYVKWTKYEKSVLYEELIMLQAKYGVNLILIDDHNKTGKILGNIVRAETTEAILNEFKVEYEAIMNS